MATIADTTRASLAEGKTNEQVLADVKAAHPTANTSAACVSYYRSKMKKAGTATAKPESMAHLDLVRYVKQYALDNYENGWDTVVECYSDEDIAKIIGKATTERGAMAKMRAHYLPYKSYADDIAATAF